jgi:hypothetical protein
VLALPIDFVAKDKDGSSYVELPPAKPADKREKKKIVLGVQTGAYVEVKSGLKEGDKVIRPVYTGPERKGMMSGGE